jgi:hypothetical protein
MAQAADLLKPLYDLMAERVRASKVIWTDDTPRAGPGPDAAPDADRAALGLRRR